MNNPKPFCRRFIVKEKRPIDCSRKTPLLVNLAETPEGKKRRQTLKRIETRREELALKKELKSLK